MENNWGGESLVEGVKLEEKKEVMVAVDNFV